MHQVVLLGADPVTWIVRFLFFADDGFRRLLLVSIQTNGFVLG
jgi:hypothetical protein